MFKVLFILLTFVSMIGQSPAFGGINQWTSSGPLGGGIRAMARSPQFSTDHTIFAGTAYDGFFISTDRGVNWTQNNSGLTNKYILSIAVSPEFATDRTIFVGTDAGGAYRSRDGGATWQRIATNIGSSSRTVSVAVSPLFASDRTLFLSIGSGGAYKSTDGGDNWSYCSLSASAPTMLFSPDYANDHTIFAGASPGGVYRSIDSGVSWQQVNAGLNSGGDVFAMAISPAYATDRTLF